MNSLPTSPPTHMARASTVQPGMPQLETCRTKASCESPCSVLSKVEGDPIDLELDRAIESHQSFLDPTIDSPSRVTLEDPISTPSVVCKSDGRVVWVNEAWLRLTRYRRAEVLDRTLEKLHGPATDAAVVRTLMQQVALQRPCGAELVSYDRAGLPFTHTLRVIPLHGPSDATFLFRVTSDAVLNLPAAAAGVPSLSTAEPVPIDDASVCFLGGLLGARAG